jgi:hypothetical protein
MWFALGLITLAGFLIHALITRAGAGWSGEKVISSERAYEIGTTTSKQSATTRIGVALPDDYEFALREETGRDRWFKQLGVNAEFSVDDAGFDSRLYIESDDAVLCRVLREQPALRTALTDALRAVKSRRGADARVRAARGRVWFEIAHPAEVRGARYVDVVVPFLHALAAALRAQALRPPLEQRDPFVARAAILLAVSSSSAAFAFVGWFWWRIGREPLVDPWALFVIVFWVGLALHAALVWLALRWLGRSARAHLVLVELVLLGLPGVVASTFWLAREANMALDFSAPRVVEVSDASIHSVRSRRSRTYYLDLGDAPVPELRGQSLRIDLDTANLLRHHSARGPGEALRARLTLRSGAFGADWVERIDRVVPATAAAAR